MSFRDQKVPQSDAMRLFGIVGEMMVIGGMPGSGAKEAANRLPGKWGGALLRGYKERKGQVEKGEMEYVQKKIVGKAGAELKFGNLQGESWESLLLQLMGGVQGNLFKGLNLNSGGPNSISSGNDPGIEYSID